MATTTAFGRVDDHVQAVMDLIEKRAVGDATNEQVDAAVSQLLHVKEQPSEHKPSTTNTITTANDVAPEKSEPLMQDEVVQDMEEYDDDDEDDPKQKNPPETPKRKTPDGKASTKRKVAPFDASQYENIPLGAQGAQMLTTFGDGRQPKPESVAAVLKGARLMLQVAIQDARCMRRRDYEWYRHAKQEVTGIAPAKKESTEIMYRATNGYDPLAYSQKCGFAANDLQTLFPEEMNAFLKFSEMHAETEKMENPEEDKKSPSSAPKTPKKSVVTKDPKEDGHLTDRAANFDIRTRNMHKDWYFQYSELRQGSFLPRRLKKDEKKTMGVGGDWGGMSLQQIRFLHWIGFDPHSSLPPPSEDTTDALAFLGYDFVGRIVEKSIFFRLLERNRESATSIVLELDAGDKLGESDVIKAMKDLSPAPIYASASRDKLPGSHPLFFGRGFENRLELEIEEFMLERKLSPEEIAVRKDEEDLFAKIAEPPEVMKKPQTSKAAAKRKRKS